MRTLFSRSRASAGSAERKFSRNCVQRGPTALIPAPRPISQTISYPLLCVCSRQTYKCGGVLYGCRVPKYLSCVLWKESCVHSYKCDAFLCVCRRLWKESRPPAHECRSLLNKTARLLYERREHCFLCSRQREPSTKQRKKTEARSNQSGATSCPRGGKACRPRIITPYSRSHGLPFGSSRGTHAANWLSPHQQFPISVFPRFDQFSGAANQPVWPFTFTGASTCSFTSLPCRSFNFTGLSVNT